MGRGLSSALLGKSKLSRHSIVILWLGEESDERAVSAAVLFWGQR